MKKPTCKPRNQAVVLVRADVLERIFTMLKEADQKLDYLIKNLRRFNGGNANHNHLNHTLTEFMD
jgi:hypothetical protein